MGKKYQILDSGLLEDKEDLLGIVKWWERHRLIYNILVLAMLIWTSSMFIDGMLYFGLGNFILVVLGFMLLANLCFCIGSSIDFLSVFYLKKLPSLRVRQISLVIGILFALLVTFSIYKDNLLYFQRATYG